MHAARGNLCVGQMFSRHLCPLYPPTGTLSEKASACLSTPNPAVPFQAKVTTTVPNCLEGSCDAGRLTVGESERGHRVRAVMKCTGVKSSAVRRNISPSLLSDVCACSSPVLALILPPGVTLYRFYMNIFDLFFLVMCLAVITGSIMQFHLVFIEILSLLR